MKLTVLLHGVAVSLGLENVQDQVLNCPELGSEWKCSKSLCYTPKAIRQCHCSRRRCLWLEKRITFLEAEDVPLISKNQAKDITLYMTLDELENS